MSVKDTGMFVHQMELVKTVYNGQYMKRTQKPQGVMLHYDESTSDKGALGWFEDPRCRVSYDRLVLDTGGYAILCPEDMAAYHAGTCRTSDPERLSYKSANQAFKGIAIAANNLETATIEQVLTVAMLTRLYFNEYNWPLTDLWRIKGHEDEAVYPEGTERAGRRGRKIDPTGPDKRKPVLSIGCIRYLVPRIQVPAKPAGSNIPNDRFGSRRYSAYWRSYIRLVSYRSDNDWHFVIENQPKTVPQKAMSMWTKMPEHP